MSGQGETRTPNLLRDQVLSLARLPISPPARVRILAIFYVSAQLDSVTNNSLAVARKFPRPRLAALRARSATLRLSNPTRSVRRHAAWASFHFVQVRPVGFEPTTVRLRGDCSTS